MSNFPIVLGESLFRVQLPAAVVLSEPVIGTLRVLLNLFSSFLQTLAAILYSRLVLRKKVPSPYCETIPNSQTAVSLSRYTIQEGFRKASPQIMRIILVTIVAVLVFTILTNYGFMDLSGPSLSRLSGP